MNIHEGGRIRSQNWRQDRWQNWHGVILNELGHGHETESEVETCGKGDSQKMFLILNCAHSSHQTFQHHSFFPSATKDNLWKTVSLDTFQGRNAMWNTMIVQRVFMLCVFFRLFSCLFISDRSATLLTITQAMSSAKTNYIPTSLSISSPTCIQLIKNDPR